MNLLTKNGLLRKVGVLLVGGLVAFFWWSGMFYLVFYILGLYAAVYIVSLIFRTTAILTAIIGIGGFILYAASAIVGLYLFFLVLQTMFTVSFFTGLFQLTLLGIFGGLLYFIPVAIGFVLGYPLIFMFQDIEKRFEKEVPGIIEAEYTENE